MRHLRSLTRRGFAAFGLIAIAAASTAAYAQTELVIYSAYPNDQLKPLIQAFEKANPQIKIKAFEQPGEEVIATLELEMRAKNPKADVVGLNEASMSYLQKRHSAFEAYAPKDIDKVKADFRNKENAFTPVFVTLYTIHFNTKKISAAEAPKSWADLLNPKWKGQIALADPAHSQSIQSFMWFIADYMGKKNPNTYGWDYFKKIAQNEPRLEASHATIRDLTISGERPLGVQVLVHAQNSARRGEPTSNIWPIEGTPGELNAFGVVKGAKNAEAGKKWLDFLVSLEAQTVVSDALGGAPVRTDVPYKYPDGTPLDKVTIIPVDSTFVAENRKSQTKKFHEAVGK